MKKIFLLFILFVTLIGLSQAQSTNRKQLRLNQLFIQDGLPEGHIFSFKQDKEGYIWIGTPPGLIRYDGYSTKLYPLTENASDVTVVSAICEDEKGGLWLGVNYKGLFYYDRRADSTAYIEDKSDNSNSLSKVRIENAVDDKNGNLWISVTNQANNEKSLVFFNTSTHKFLHYSVHEKGNFHLSSAYITNLIKTRNGSIWVGSDNGIFLFDYNRFKFVSYYTTNDTARQFTLKSLCEDPVKDGWVWAISSNASTTNSEELIKFNVSENGIKLHTYSLQTDFANKTKYVYKIIRDSKQRLWILSDMGFYLYDLVKNRFILFPHKLDMSYLNADTESEVIEDENGNLWVIFNSKGLLHRSGVILFDTKRENYIQYINNPLQKDGFASDFITKLFQDRERNIWFATAAIGIQWINKKASNFYTFTESFKVKYGITENVVFNSCAEAADHTFWIANTNGLYHWFPQRDSMVMLRVSQKSFNKPTGKLMIDNDNKVWFCGDDGSGYKGIFCYNPVTGKLDNYSFSEEDSTSISSNQVNVLFKDHSGDIWIGTWGGGLCKFDEGRQSFVRYPFVEWTKGDSFPSVLNGSRVTTIFEDKNRELWIGTSGGGINKLKANSKSFTSFNSKVRIGLPTSISEDSADNLWISTYNQGLAIFNKKTFKCKWITERDGLLYNGVDNVLKDNDGNAWIISLRGVSILNEQLKVIRHLTSDLLQRREHLITSSLKTANGSFIFPGTNGPVILNPDDFLSDTTTPIVHIESIVYTKQDAKHNKFDSAIVRFGKHRINLAYDENRIMFNYVGLIYQNVSQVQYKYKLDGYDNDWVNANTQRTITYTNLSPGTYTFHVTAANSDGIWSTKEDTIAIVISPPWWQTVWFRAILILTIAGLMFLSLRYYLRRKLKVQQQQFERLKEIEKIRSKISMDIHDEISSELTKISLLSQRVKAGYGFQKKAEQEMIDKIVGSSKKVINNLGEIIWAVDPKYDSLPSLLAYLRDHVANFFDQANIETYVSFPDDVEAITISPDIKHNIFLVTKEILNNIVKHSKASRVELQFINTNDTYTFTITDNGEGMDSLNGRAFGNGLTNIQKRMNAIKGTITIHSQKGHGTQIILKGRFA